MSTQYVDLHVHSTCSDGYCSPEELLDLAVRAGLAAIALADHDNVDGIAPALRAGAARRVEVIPAVELSSQWYQYTDMHLLGYGFDYQDPYLLRALSEFQEFRVTRNLKIIDRVNQKLAAENRRPIDPVEVQLSAGGTIGRPHIAQALIRAGYVAGNDEAFERYLVPCNVAKRYFPADEAIRLIHASGGIVVLAHPPYLTRDRRKLESLVAELVGIGLDGIEAYNNGAGLEDTDWLIKLARQYDLIVTGGSDFHGGPASLIAVGRGVHGIRVPYACVLEIKRALKERQSKAGSPSC